MAASKVAFCGGGGWGGFGGDSTSALFDAKKFRQVSARVFGFKCRNAFDKVQGPGGLGVFDVGLTAFDTLRIA